MLMVLSPDLSFCNEDLVSTHRPFFNKVMLTSIKIYAETDTCIWSHIEETKDILKVARFNESPEAAVFISEIEPENINVDGF